METCSLLVGLSLGSREATLFSPQSSVIQEPTMIAAPQMMVIGDGPSASVLKRLLLLPAPALAVSHTQQPAVAAAAEKQFRVGHPAIRVGRPAMRVMDHAVFRILLLLVSGRLLV